MTDKKSTTAGKRPDPKVKERIQEVITLLPAHRHRLTNAQAFDLLKAKKNSQEVRAIVSVVQYAREDALAAGLSPDLNERQAGYYAGYASGLAELERVLRDATAIQE